MLGACSVERNNVFSKSYHNTTARYNGYFLAKEKMKELKREVKKSHIEDYNKTLPIYYPLNDKSTSSIAPMIEDIIKKASIPIQRHKNSRWIEESYILIGTARYYKKDFSNAIETFKYINTVSKNDKDRHAALIQLLLTFIEDEQMNNATAVVDYLNQEKITRRNRANFYKAKAYYFFLREDIPRTILNLRRSVYYTWNGDEKARLHFIIGQLYQEINKPNAAYVHYKLCLRKGPPYELGFFAKLYMAQNLEEERSGDTKKILRNFKKLLKDRKNLEYRDKIYYEMAKFDLKRDNVTGAMRYIRQSLDISSNPVQKGYTYLLAGKISYERLREFEQAKYFYDSAVSTLDKTLPEYPDIVKRQKVLDEFVTQLKIIRKEDSLQRMANMDTTSLNALIAQKVAEEKAKLTAQREQEKKAKANSNAFGGIGDMMMGGGIGASGGSGGAGGFYFSDPSAISRGKSDFALRWGQRPLEDNWRRLNKEKIINDDVDSQNDGDEGSDEEMDSNDKPILSAKDEKAAFQQELEKLEKTVRSQILKDIPNDEKALQESNDRLKKALYTIGKIYDQKLREPDNAILRFEELISRYPNYEKEAEVLYYLYILYGAKGSPKAEQYKRILLEKYFNTSYAQKAINPNYTEESRAINDVVRKRYREAYELYTQGFFQRSDSLVALTMNTFKINDYNDRLALLRIMNSAKIKGITEYKLELTAFLDDYKNSELQNHVKSLIKAVDDYMEESVSGKKKEQQKQSIYSFDKDAKHFSLIAYSSKSINIAGQINGFASFNDKNFSTDKLNVSQMILNDVYLLVLVKEFKNKNEALVYLDKVSVLDSPIQGLKDSDYKLMVISADNFLILFRNKRLDEYLEFYKAFY